MALGMGPVVRLVNRVVNEAGERVPQDVTFGGEALTVRDTLDVPLGAARVIMDASRTSQRIDPALSRGIKRQPPRSVMVAGPGSGAIPWVSIKRTWR